MQHSKQTMRGGSELAESEESSDNGLALEYATAWSYGRAESWNMLIPDFMGGDSGRTFERDGEVARALRPYGLSDLAQQLPAYWGEQPYTAGPTYLGAAAIFLAVLGLLLASGRNKWWIVAVSLLALLLAWGHNFMGFTEFMFKYLPGYNKFRTVSMILVVIEWTVPLLAALALMPLWRGEVTRRKLLRALAWAGGITGGICLIFALVGGSILGFGRTESAEMMMLAVLPDVPGGGMEDAIAQGIPEELGEVTADAMAVDRAAILRADAWRSLLMIVLAAGSVLLFALGRLKRGGLIAALAVIVLIDLIPVNLRYLPQSRFVSGRQNKIVQTEADRTILRDPELGFRVLNLTVSPFNDATTSYFHRSVGGYHGAKLARYQDLIEHYLSLMDEGVLDMLNTRYVIQYDQNSGQPTAYLRPTANGAAWFVDGIVDASTPREEIDALGYTDLKTTAVINTEEFGGNLPAAGGEGRDPSDGVPSQLPQIPIYGRRPGAGRLLGDLLPRRLEGLHRRQGGPLPAGRLRAAGHGAACRHPYGRVAFPRPALGDDRRDHPCFIAGDPSWDCSQPLYSFYAMKDDKRLKRKVRNSYIVSNVSIALVLFLLGSVGYLLTAAMQMARTLQESVSVTVELRNGLSEEQKGKAP